MKRWIVVVAMLGSLAAHAGDMEYGSLEELKGKSKLFVDTGVKMELRRAVITGIKERAPSVAIVDSIEASDMALEFVGNSECGEAAIYVDGKTAIRLLGHWEGCPKTPFLSAMKAAGRWFGEAYSRANR